MPNQASQQALTENGLLYIEFPSELWEKEMEVTYLGFIKLARETLQVCTLWRHKCQFDDDLCLTWQDKIEQANEALKLWINRYEQRFNKKP